MRARRIAGGRMPDESCEDCCARGGAAQSASRRTVLARVLRLGVSAAAIPPLAEVLAACSSNGTKSATATATGRATASAASASPPIAQPTATPSTAVAARPAGATPVTGGLAATPAVTVEPSGAIIVPKEALPAPGAAPLAVPQGGFFLVNLLAGEGGLGPIPSSQTGGLLALSSRCTHLDCQIAWQPTEVLQGSRGWFVCPCHNAHFTRGGVRGFGPAPRSLDTLRLSFDADGSVRVDTASPPLTGAAGGDLDNDPQRAQLPPGSTPVAATATAFATPIAGPSALATPSPTAPAGPPVTSFDLVMGDNTFSATAILVPSATPITARVRNDGIAVHNFHVLAQDAQGNASRTDLLDQGRAQTLTFTIATPGTYAFQCDVHPTEQHGALFVR